jgi:hypothetical protein
MAETPKKKSTATATISRFLKADPNPPKAGEILTFKKSCTDEEWTAFATQVPA